MLKVLILSYECWRDDTNGGNVLSNIFAGQEFTFAQVYCKPGKPQNALCRQYYHMTDGMMLQNILHGAPVGETLLYEAPPCAEVCRGGAGESAALEQPCQSENAAEPAAQGEARSKRFYDFFRAHNLASFYAARELLWKCAHWKNEGLVRFVTEFDPDVIFAPYYASHLMLALDRFVIGLLKKPAISYVSDDNYTLRQLRFSPVYWVDRLLLRRHVRQTVPYFRFLYTMTQEQAQQMHRDLGCEMRVLCKSGNFPETFAPRAVHSPVRLIYAGGLYLGRDKTLAALARAARAVNEALGERRLQLDIYTGSPLSARQKQALEGGACMVHGAVSMERLRALYAQSDVALHVESFSARQRLAVRLSFSTKIVDCLESGCAVLAVCEEKQAGFAYLKREDAALCVCEVRALKQVLCRLATEPGLIQEYAEKAWRCGRAHHSADEMRARLREDFCALAQPEACRKEENA